MVLKELSDNRGARRSPLTDEGEAVSNFLRHALCGVNRSANEIMATCATIVTHGARPPATDAALAFIRRSIANESPPTSN